MLVDKLLTRVGFVETGREDGGGDNKAGTALVDKPSTRVGFVETGREDGGGKTKQGLPHWKVVFAQVTDAHTGGAYSINIY